MRLPNRPVASAGLVALLVGQLSCGGGVPVKATGPASSTVAGTVVKGPLSGGAIAAYQLDSALHLGAELATTTTDGSGNFTLTVPPYDGALLVVASTGSYTEEALGLGVQLDGHQLTAIVPSFQTGVPVAGLWVTPISTLATALATWHVQEKGELAVDALGDAYSHLNAHFGGVDWRSTAPIDVTAGPVTSMSAGVTEGLLLGALSYEALTMALKAGVSPGLTVNAAILTEALTEDISDGTLDGVGPSGPLSLPSGISLVPDGGATATALGSAALRLLLGQALMQFIASSRNASGLHASDVQVLANALATDTDPYLFCVGQQPSAACSTTTSVTDPVITWDAPGADAGVHGIVPLEVEAQAVNALTQIAVSGPVSLLDGGTTVYDDQGCSAGQHHCHGVLEGQVDVSALADGAVTFVATAVDAFGNSASSSLQVEVDNHGPILTVASPTALSDLKGSVSVAATAQAQQGVIASLVVLSPPAGLGPNLLPAASSYSATWDTTQTLDGPATLRFVATDTFGASTEVDVAVTVDNLPFAQVTAVVFAGEPVSGANVAVLAINDADGGLLNVGDGGPVLGASTTPTDSSGQTLITLSVKNFVGDVRLQASGVGLQYSDPSDGVTPIEIPGSFLFTSTLAGYDSSTQTALTVPVDLWTTLADGAALAYAQGANASHLESEPLSAALTLANTAFEAHITQASWSLRATVPALLTQPPTQTLRDVVYAALPDLALNQLARDWSLQAGLTPGQVITAPSVVATLLGQDLPPDDVFNGLGYQGLQIATPGSPPIDYDANSTRAAMALSLDRWLRSAQNQSGLVRADVLNAGVYNSLCLDQSPFYPPAAVQPPLPWSSIASSANPPVITWISPVNDGGAHGTVEVQVEATDETQLTAFAFIGALQPQAATLALLPTDAGSAELLTGTLDVSSFPDGPTTLTALATDSAGNSTASSITFETANAAPTLTVSSPTSGSVVSGTVAVTATAETSTGVIASLVLVNPPAGVSANASSAAATFAASWDTSQDLEGPLTLHFEATTGYGAVAEFDVPVSVHNVPFGFFSVSVSAGAPIADATVSVYALNGDGGLADRGDAGALLGQGGPTDINGNTSFFLTGENFAGPVQVTASGTNLLYLDPSAPTDAGITVPPIELQQLVLTSTLPSYTTGTQATVPVTLWTTLADAAANAYAAGLNPTQTSPTSISEALLAVDPLFENHLAPGWDLRATLPVTLTRASQQLGPAVYAALPDVALNQLARLISAQTGIDTTAVNLVSGLQQDLQQHGQFTGDVLPFGTYTFTANTTRVQLAEALDEFMVSAQNATRITQPDMLASQIYTAMSEDTSALYPSGQPPQAFDVTPPTVAFAASFVTEGGLDAGAVSYGGGLLVAGTCAITANASASVSVASLALAVNQSPLAPTQGNTSSRVVDTYTTTLLPDGPFEVVATATDVLGNTGTTTLALTSDNTPPVAQVLSPSPTAFYSFTTGSAAAAPIQISATDLHGPVVSALDAGFDLTPVLGNAPSNLMATWRNPNLADGTYQIPFVAQDAVGNTTPVTATVQVDQTAPTVSFFTGHYGIGESATLPPAYTRSPTYTFAFNASDGVGGSGVGAISVYSVPTGAIAASLPRTLRGVYYPGTATVPLGNGANTFSITATDNALPQGNSSSAHPLTATILLDQQAPALIPVSTPSYRSEVGVGVRSSNGVPTVPVVYENLSPQTAITGTGTTSAIYKVLGHQGWGTQPTAAVLEGPNPDNIPFIQYDVGYVASTDAPIGSVVYSVSCTSGCASSVAATGSLWPSPTTGVGVLVYDLPLASNLFPALTTITTAAALAVTVTATDAAGNASTNTLNLTYTVVAPPITWVTDSNYPNEGDASSIYPYTIASGTYQQEFTPNSSAFIDDRARLARYVLYNPTAEAVAVSFALSAQSWTPLEQWNGVTFGLPGSAGSPYSYLVDGYLFQTPVTFNDAPDPCQIVDYMGDTSSNPGCANDPESPCHPGPNATAPFHTWGAAQQWQCSNTMQTPIELGSSGPTEPASITPGAPLLVSAYLNPQAGGGERTPVQTDSQNDIIIPAATATAPGAVVVYLGHLLYQSSVVNPVRGTSTPIAQAWQATNLDPGSAGGAYQLGIFDFWNFVSSNNSEDGAANSYFAGDNYSVTRGILQLVSASESASATFGITTFGLDGTTPVAQPTPIASGQQLNMTWYH